MNPQPRRHSPYLGLLLGFAAVLIVADQLSKAWFVYRLGSHSAADFFSFCAEYFTLWVSDLQGRGVIDNYMPFQPPIRIYEDWIQFNLTTNNGAAWSLFANNSFALSFVSLAMAGLLYYIWQRSFRHHLGMTWALGAIIGGALGNFVDRFRLKEVVDFIDVKIPYLGRLFSSIPDPYDFPIFNVADSAAVCGTIALALYLIYSDIVATRRRLRERHHPKPAPFPEGHGLDYDPAALEELKRGGGEIRINGGSLPEGGAETPAAEDQGQGRPRHETEVESAEPEQGPSTSGEAEDGTERARKSAEN
jgi:signal peptidase II